MKILRMAHTTSSLRSLLKESIISSLFFIILYVDAVRYTVAVGLAADDGESVLDNIGGSPFTFIISADGNVDVKPSAEHHHKGNTLSNQSHSPI